MIKNIYNKIVFYWKENTLIVSLIQFLSILASIALVLYSLNYDNMCVEILGAIALISISILTALKAQIIHDTLFYLQWIFWHRPYLLIKPNIKDNGFVLISLGNSLSTFYFIGGKINYNDNHSVDSAKYYDNPDKDGVLWPNRLAGGTKNTFELIIQKPLKSNFLFTKEEKHLLARQVINIRVAIIFKNRKSKYIHSLVCSGIGSFEQLDSQKIIIFISTKNRNKFYSV